jgi:cytochrome c peroxidase
LEIFNTERGDCFHCHGGILFTDNMFHNTGLDAEPGDKGLSAVTGDPLDRGRFKTPTLRNIEVTAPYMHDGRFRTLEEVVDFYSEGVQNSPTIDPLMKFAHQGGVRLTAQERSDLIAFLKTLTDTTFLTNPAFGNPF